MLNNIKRSLKHSTIYSIGTIASKLIGIVLLPLYTKHIDLNDFGVYGLFEIILQLLPVIALGLPSALQRWLGLKEYSAIRGKLLFTSFAFLTVYPLILFLILIPLTPRINNIFFQSDYSAVFYILYAIVYVQLPYRISMVLLRMDERSTYYAIANSLKIAVQLGMIIYLITIENLGFISIFWGELAGTLVLFIITFPYLLKNLTFHFEFKKLISMIKFGAPLIFGNFSRQIFSFSDRNFLSFFISEAAVGTYVLGFKISSILETFLVSSFSIAFPAIAWQQVGTENQNRFFSKMLTYFSFVLVWASLFLAVYGEGILHQFALDKSYWDASLVIPLLVTGFIFNGMYTIINYGLLISKKTERIPIIVLLSLAVDVGLNLILVSRFSFIGTAIAMMVTAITRTFLTHLFSRKVFPVKWEFRKISLMLLVAIILYLLTSLFDSYEFFYRILIKGSIILTFPFLLYLFNFYEEIELDTIKRIAKKYMTFHKT